jgi:hypothetical protein
LCSGLHVGLAISRWLPVYSEQRTLPDHPGMSQKCHQRTHAPEQLAGYSTTVFDAQLAPGAASDASGRLNRYQQPKDCLQSNASLANERCRLKFCALVGIRSGKSHGGNVSSKRADVYGRTMLSTGHFTLPLAAVTLIAPDVIKDRAATKHDAIAQYGDASRTPGNAIKQFCAYRIKSVSNHRSRPCPEQRRVYEV